MSRRSPQKRTRRDEQDQQHHPDGDDGGDVEMHTNESISALPSRRLRQKFDQLQQLGQFESAATPAAVAASSSSAFESSRPPALGVPADYHRTISVHDATSTFDHVPALPSPGPTHRSNMLTSPYITTSHWNTAAPPPASATVSSSSLLPFTPTGAIAANPTTSRSRKRGATVALALPSFGMILASPANRLAHLTSDHALHYQQSAQSFLPDFLTSPAMTTRGMNASSFLYEEMSEESNALEIPVVPTVVADPTSTSSTPSSPTQTQARNSNEVTPLLTYTHRESMFDSSSLGAPAASIPSLSSRANPFQHRPPAHPEAHKPRESVRPKRSTSSSTTIVASQHMPCASTTTATAATSAPISSASSLRILSSLATLPSLSSIQVASHATQAAATSAHASAALVLDSTPTPAASIPTAASVPSDTAVASSAAIHRTSSHIASHSNRLPVTAHIPTVGPSIAAVSSTSSSSSVHAAAVALPSSHQSATPALAQSQDRPFIPQARTVVSSARETLPATVIPTSGSTPIATPASTVVAAAAPTLIASTASVPTPSQATPTITINSSVALPAGIVRSTHENTTIVSSIPATDATIQPVIASAVEHAVAIDARPVLATEAQTNNVVASPPSQPMTALALPLTTHPLEAKEVMHSIEAPVEPIPALTISSSAEPVAIPSPHEAVAAAILEEQPNSNIVRNPQSVIEPALVASLSLHLMSARHTQPTLHLAQFRPSSPPAVDPASTVDESVAESNTDASRFLSCVKIPNPECQRLVIEAVNFLDQQFPHMHNMTNTASPSAAASTAPAPSSVEGVAFDSMRTSLLAHLASAHPTELTMLLHRTSQHALYIHAYGWSQYGVGFTHPPEVPMLRDAMAACHQHTKQKKSNDQEKAKKREKIAAKHHEMSIQSNQPAAAAAWQSIMIDPRMFLAYQNFATASSSASSVHQSSSPISHVRVAS